MRSGLNFFAPYKRILRRAEAVSNLVESYREKFSNMSNDDLSNMTNIFIDRLKKGETLEDIAPEAFAVAREAIYRVQGLFAYKVQVMGAYIVHNGDFAEMYTGEGKTLTIVLVAYLNALSKLGVHVVTVNEYLVQRDAHFCAQCLNPLGITVGYNIAALSQPEKKAMYNCDITYTTNSELGFDYLRDNMVHNYDEKVIRKLNFAIVDECDSVLIDEARTPLIIAGQPKKDISMYIDVDKYVKTLKKEDYKIEPESNSISFTEQGVAKTEAFYRIENLFDFKHSELYHKLKNALTANFVFQVGVEYVVRGDEILLVDQFTGRILEGRSYNAGLQQAIQAKELVKIEPENVTVATITYQSFFRLYSKLAGISGTGFTEQEEFLKIYNMIVVPVPTNKKVIRKDLNDFVFDNKISKWKHVVYEIERVHKTGQPILVGTVSVEDSEELCHWLRNKGLPYELLNARNNEREAEIVKNAGLLGAITISTNMAGRGTDIKLGEGVVELGGLYVIGTERNESRRIDNQLRGRSGRQGDPGVTRFFISLEDTIFRRYAGDKFKKANNKVQDDDYFDSWFFTRLLNSTQKKIEGINFDMRKNLIDYDNVLSRQRELVYSQRDQLLLSKNNDIVEAMCKTVANDIVEIFKSKENPLYVKHEELTATINKKIFNVDLLKPNLFFEVSTEQCAKIIFEILRLSVRVRADLLGEQGWRTYNNIVLQSLDYQWTEHLDKIGKLREGVSLRSLEQRSPLNIYVQEADWHFNEMRKNVAHGVIISIHKIFVPKANETFKEALTKLLPTLEITDDVISDLPRMVANDKINLDFSISSEPISPKDKVQPEMTIEEAKAKLLKKVAEQKK